MTERQHTTLFVISLTGCLVMTLTFEMPIRNYVPVVWAIFGFGLHGFWAFKAWVNLSKQLVFQHQDQLDQMKIRYISSQFKTTVDMFALLKQRKKIENISTDIKIRLSFFRTFFRLTVIAFLMFGILGLITVILTWK